MQYRRDALNDRPISPISSFGRMSGRSVGVAAMVDTEHCHCSLPLVDPIQDAVTPSACAVDASEFVAQLWTDATGILDQGSGDEIDDGGADRLGQSRCDRQRRWTGNYELVAGQPARNSRTTTDHGPLAFRRYERRDCRSPGARNGRAGSGLPTQLPDLHDSGRELAFSQRRGLALATTPAAASGQTQVGDRAG